MEKASPVATTSRRWGVVLSVCVLGLALAFVAVRALPALDAWLDPARAEPGAVTFVGTGLVIVLLTALVLWVVLRQGLRMGVAFVVFAITYNVLIVLVKFTLATRTLYVENRSLLWRGTLGTWAGAAFGIFLMYAAVFLALAWVYRRRALRARAKPVPGDAPWGGRAGHLLPTALLACFFTAVGFFVVSFALGDFLVFDFGFGSTTKLDAYLRFGTGAAVALALTAAIVFATAAFDTLAKRAAAVKDAALVTSFAFIGLAVLAVFHVLWVVYIMLVVSLWPLRTATGSGK